MSLITYLLQVSGCITLFYVFYYACLSRLTFFTVNRYYLISSLLLSFVIPLITVPVYSTYTVLANTTVMQLPSVTHIAAKPLVAMHPVVIKHTTITWLMLVKWVYTLVGGLLLLHFAVSVAMFFVNLRKQRVEYNNGLHIIRSDRKLTNGSFFNYIFLDDAQLKSEEAEQVIAHEILHARLMHSFDRILGRIAQIILWFNPVLYLYTRAIEQNHEFEVDGLLTDNTNKQSYAGLLLQLSVSTGGGIYNSFSKTPLQQRVTMLFNARSSKGKQLVYLLVVPLLTLSLIAFANVKRIVTPKALNRSVSIMPQVKITVKQPVQQTTITKTAEDTSIGTPAKDSDVNAKKPTITNARYSVIQGVEKLGKNPLVLIDDKEYPADILYKIGNACIRGYGLFLPQGALLRFGNRASDGAVQIRTKNGTITDQTDIEISNLTTMNAADNNEIIRRVVLRKADGTLYDKMIAEYNGTQYLDVDISHNAKIAIFIDSVFYTEQDANRVMSEKISKTPSRGVAYLKKEKMPDGNLHGYEAVMWFYSSPKTLPKTAKNRKDYFESLDWEKRIPVN